MGERGDSSRREFLQRLAGLLAAATAIPFAQTAFLKALAQGESPDRASNRAVSAAGASKPDLPAHYSLSPWTGDNWTNGHKLRIRDFPSPFPQTAQARADFVIVGGGVAGLAAAYYLKDHDFLLLEQYERLGGQSIGSSYRGIDYSLGAAYIGEPTGICQELYDNLGITPLKLPPNHNSFFFEGRWLSDISAGSSDSLSKEFQRFFAESQAVYKCLPKDDSPDLISGPDLTRLDMARFAESLKGYSSQFCSLVESFLKSACCGGAQQLSALTGYWMMSDLIATDYVFAGGNPAIANALAQKIALSGDNRCRTEAFVWQVELKDSGASVVYTAKDGSLQRVDCRHVIIAAPPLVAARILKNIDDRMRGNLLFFTYGSYLVANCLLDKKIFAGTYDSFVSTPFTFADMVVAETPYLLSGSYKAEMGSVLTIYQPYAPASIGRGLLYEGKREELAGSLFEQLSNITEHLGGHLEHMVLTRWGHAMPVAGPGYFQRMQNINAGVKGAYSLAHNSQQGLPCAESAIRAARAAASRALRTTGKISCLVN